MNIKLQKTKRHAFGKDIYLLGRDSDGTNYWLEAGSWDCGWYWGFGYVETYTRNNDPVGSKDIQSHQHIDSSFLGEGNAKDGGYCHNLFDSKLLASPVFTEDEGWKLSELFNSFYLLNKTADFFYTGGSGVTGILSIQKMKNKRIYELINKKLIPEIMSEIYKILEPKK